MVDFRGLGNSPENRKKLEPTGFDLSFEILASVWADDSQTVVRSEVLEVLHI